MLAHIIPVSGGLPDQSLPISPGHPSHDLPSGAPGHIWGAILRLLGGAEIDNDLPGDGGQIWGSLLRLLRWIVSRPHVGGGPSKPPGIPIIPIDPAWGIEAPSGPPPWSGGWVPVDPGFGKPPVWGILPVDPGYGIGAPVRPDQGLPDTPGHYVPCDPNYGIPERERHCGGGYPSTQPIVPRWVWIPEIGPDFGKPKPVPKPSPK